VNTDRIVNLRARLEERAKREAADDEQMDVKMRLAEIAVDAVKAMRECGATYDEIARSLQVVLDDLRSI
jgi:hypothetical protein